MCISKYDSILNSIKEIQTHERFRHTLGVAYTAASLAMKHEADIEKAYLAGILHDCAKCISDDLILNECIELGLEINQFERSCPYLLHAKLGAHYADVRYGISDEEVLRSVIYHTTGRPAMGLIEKIIFIADYIEPNRYKAPDLHIIRRTAFEDTDLAVYMIIRDTINYLERNNMAIDTASFDTYNYYKQFSEDALADSDQ